MSHCASRIVPLFSLIFVPFISSGLLLAAEDPTDLQTSLTKEGEGGVVTRVGDVNDESHPFEAWQLGYVREEKGWSSYEDVVSSPKEKEYLAKRDELKNDPDRHLKLANWCVRNQLRERARAHYFGVLSTQPNHAEARAFVGHVFLGKNWVELSAFRTAQMEMKATIKSLEKWVPKFEEILADLKTNNANTKSNNSKHIGRALSKLESIPADEALPALMFFASNVDDDLAKPLIRRIATVRSRNACHALVLVALNHPSDSIRLLTCSAIREYGEDFYVPELLGLLTDDAQMEYRLIANPNGRVALETVYHHELMDRKQVEKSLKLIHVASLFSSNRRVSFCGSTSADVSYWSEFWKINPSSPKHMGNVNGQSKHAFGSGASQLHVSYVPKVVVESVSASLNEEVQQYQRELAKRNRDQKIILNRVYSVLRETTKSDLEDSPKQWWGWWNEHNERYIGNKPIDLSNKYKVGRVIVGTKTAATESNFQNFDLGPVMIQYSCLVPGTPIQTSSGLVPIESIQVGDYVLSQDVETAELTYKPVILTTLRPPKETIKIKTNSELIEATGGHLWWVSGKGWIKSRDLIPGMVLHTVRGTVPIESVEENPELQPTHNLVVDGFHTYFVGENRVLSYDNSQLVPTLKRVPGVVN